MHFLTSPVFPFAPVKWITARAVRLLLHPPVSYTNHLLQLLFMRQLITLLLLLLLQHAATAQTSLHVESGGSFYMSAGSVVFVDSLVLMPSTPYTISGNELVRNAATVNPLATTYLNRAYRWSATAPSFTGNIGFYYRDAELNTLAEPGLTLYLHNGTTWTALPPLSRDGAANYVQTNVAGMALNEFTLASISGALPLRWLSAEARYQDGHNQVQWITAAEQNCKDYQVQKSSDGVNWYNLLATVPAKNTSGPNTYRLTDPETPLPVSWYRIKQNDLDGRSSYSIALVVRLGAERIVQVYPNPFTTQLTVSVNNSKLQMVQVHNAAGVMVEQTVVKETRQHSINTVNWAAGTYLVTVVLTDGSRHTSKVIKSN